MFTGIVTHLGTVVALEHDAAADTALLTLDAGGALDGLPAGGSLAVDGVCLTALDEPTERPGVFRADLMGQTLRMTSLGDRAPGDRVNLERCLRPTDHLRLKNFTIGFTAPKHWTQKLGVNTLRLYAAGNNLLTWKDKMLVVDPEQRGFVALSLIHI